MHTATERHARYHRNLAPAAEELTASRSWEVDSAGKGRRLRPDCDGPLIRGMQVVNEPGTTKRDLYSVFHELTDDAYFKNVILVTAANNMPIASFPSLYASVISVASQTDLDPYHFSYNPPTGRLGARRGGAGSVVTRKLSKQPATAMQRRTSPGLYAGFLENIRG